MNNGRAAAGGYMEEMDKLIANEDRQDDMVSQSSRLSRTSSFKKAGFGSLIRNEEEENALDNFFAAERHYLILTNAGKPVYSM